MIMTNTSYRSGWNINFLTHIIPVHTGVLICFIVLVVTLGTSEYPKCRPVYWCNSKMGFVLSSTTETNNFTL